MSKHDFDPKEVAKFEGDSLDAYHQGDFGRYKIAIRNKDRELFGIEISNIALEGFATAALMDYPNYKECSDNNDVTGIEENLDKAKGKLTKYYEEVKTALPEINPEKVADFEVASWDAFHTKNEKKLADTRAAYFKELFNVELSEKAKKAYPEYAEHYILYKKALSEKNKKGVTEHLFKAQKNLIIQYEEIKEKLKG